MHVQLVMDGLVWSCLVRSLIPFMQMSVNVVQQMTYMSNARRSSAKLSLVARVEASSNRNGKSKELNTILMMK